MHTTRHTLVGASVALAIACVPAPESAAAPEVFLTAAHRDGVPQRAPAHSFGCDGRVFAVVDAGALADGPHRLKVLWIDPRGKRRERSQVDFESGGGGLAWSWLRLRPPEDAALERYLLGDATAGFSEFVGVWHARVYVDGVLIRKEQFRIAC